MSALLVGSPISTQSASTCGWPRALALWVLSVVLTLPGCRRDADQSPPKIAYGETECEFCRMIVSDEPFAAAAVIRSGDGVKKIAFDDIGCLLDYMLENPQQDVTGYVHDYDSRVWIEASQATFFRSEALQTPMASHLAAFVDAASSEAMQPRFPGKRVSYADLRAEKRNNP